MSCTVRPNIHHIIREQNTDHSYEYGYEQGYLEGELKGSMKCIEILQTIQQEIEQEIDKEYTEDLCANQYIRAGYLGALCIIKKYTESDNDT